MKGNTKYTALEILTEAGVENPSEVFGKVAVTIAGISGIVNPDHVILIGNEEEKAVVIVGNEAKEVAVEKRDGDQEASEGTKVVLEAKGRAETEKIEAREAEKEEKVEVKVEE
jgi:hypothetical protein